MSYQIRKLEHHEFDMLIPLMKDCFGMNVNIEYFQWKFLKNPSGFVEGFIAVAEDGEVAAYYGVIPETYIFNGVEKMIYQSCDTMTHSKHRRRGLFEKLALHCYDYLKSNNKLFVIGFGGVTSTPGFIKFGWKHIFDVSYFFYPKIFSRLRIVSNTQNITELKNYSEIENAVLKSNCNSIYHSHKSLSVFNWRLSNPSHEYKVIAYKPDGNGTSYTSYLCYYYFEEKIMLFDFYFQDSKAGKELTGYLKNLVGEFSYKGIVAFCQEDSAYSATLRKNGFIKNPFNRGPLSAKTPFIIFTGKEAMEKYASSGKWQINSFDHDAM